jgi:ketosteroid isomerase-like protein
MTTTQFTRVDLQAIVDGFFDAWARHDLDAAMAYMADDAIYDEFNTKLWKGKAQIREGFLPQFRGDYGDIQFHVEDMFIDADAGEALARWLCVFQWKGTQRSWRGLDILRFRDGLITEKLTYAKTERPLTAVESLDEVAGSG